MLYPQQLLPQIYKILALNTKRRWRRWASALSVAKSYPTSEVRGWPRVLGSDCAGTAKRSYPAPEVGGDGEEEIPRI